MNIDIYMGQKLFCGECGHRFVVTSDMKILTILRDKGGKVTGVTVRCERCGEDVFVVAHRQKR